MFKIDHLNKGFYNANRDLHIKHTWQNFSLSLKQAYTKIIHIYIYGAFQILEHLIQIIPFITACHPNPGNNTSSKHHTFFHTHTFTRKISFSNSNPLIATAPCCKTASEVKTRPSGM